MGQICHSKRGEIRNTSTLPVLASKVFDGLCEPSSNNLINSLISEGQEVISHRIKGIRHVLFPMCPRL
jgi:hypothetical protein